MWPLTCFSVLTLVVLVFQCVTLIEGRAFDPDRSCHQRGCQETSLNECSQRGHSWAEFTSYGVQTCLCCFDEKDALLAAGVNSNNEVGHFFGNILRVCEALHIDEGHCRSRESRDCNFIPAFKGANYLGCFYCRPRCEQESDCQDLGRTCDLSKTGQPVRSCTGTGSGYIPGFDDPREYEAAIKKNYLLKYKNRTRPVDQPSTIPLSMPTTTMLPITMRPLSLGQLSKTQGQPKPSCHPGKSGSPSLCSSSSSTSGQIPQVQSPQQPLEALKTPPADSSSFKKPFASKKRPQQEPIPTKVNQDPVIPISKINQQPTKAKPSYKPYPNSQPSKGTPTWSAISQQQQPQVPQPQVDQESAESTVITDSDSGAVHGEPMIAADDDSSGWDSSSHSSSVHSDEGFEFGRSPHSHGKPTLIHPASARTTTTTSNPIQLERGFKPADSNETLYVVKNNHRQIHIG